MVTWDEQGIKAHDAERGVKFGTMKIDQVDTPYLYLEQDGDTASIHHKYLKSHVPTAQQTGALDPHKMQVKELQDALGLVMTDECGLASFSRPKWAHAEEFGLQRQEMYAGEARVAGLAALNDGLPDGWTVLLSRSEPVEPFYYNRELNVTQWERPT